MLMHLPRIPIATLAMITLALPTAPTFAAVCTPPGEIVVTDPAGDGPTPETDILDISFYEVVAGVHAGKIVVTLRVSTLAGSPSGLWFVAWEDATGDNQTTLSVSMCAGSPNFTYSYQTPEDTQSGSPDGGSYTASGTFEWIIARDKIGNPTDGQTFEQITGIAMPWVTLDPLPGCIPQGGAEGTDGGRYVLGSCLVDAPAVRPPVALRLGSPAPNPTRGDVSLALDVPAEMAGQGYDVAMFDMAGRRVRTIVSGLATPGRTMLRWNLRDARGERVRPGTYWARITVGGERRAQTVIVH